MPVLDGACITREQFLLREMKIVCALHNEGVPADDIVSRATEENLFQYPTERMVGNIAKVCCKRIDATQSNLITEIIATGNPTAAAQANLYAMMCTYPLVHHFMTELVARKYSTYDYSLSTMDMNTYMSDLQYEYDNIAEVSDLTIGKIKQVLRKGLIECGMLESARSEALIPILIDPAVRSAIAQKGDARALSAFNCQDVI